MSFKGLTSSGGYSVNLQKQHFRTRTNQEADVGKAEHREIFWIHFQSDLESLQWVISITWSDLVNVLSPFLTGHKDIMSTIPSRLIRLESSSTATKTCTIPGLVTELSINLACGLKQNLRQEFKCIFQVFWEISSETSKFYPIFTYGQFNDGKEFFLLA